LAAEDLESLLAQCVAAGQAAWPGLHLDPVLFVTWLAERLPPRDRPRESLPRWHTSDLYLACACARGEGAAIRTLEETFLAKIPLWVRRLDPSPEFGAEVQQKLREKLLVATGGELPRIAEYSGLGSLEGWLRVCATRTALNLLRDRKAQPAGALDEAATLVSEADPELDYIRQRYGGEFQDALAAAAARLPPDDLNLLRLYFHDRLRVDQLAGLLRVDKSNASRRLARARQRLLAETRALLCRRLRLSETEFRSLMRVVRSQLQVSLSTLFAPPKP
jgi:RNA polymerase sigma-70 factor (ECF subfamily)